MKYILFLICLTGVAINAGAQTIHKDSPVPVRTTDLVQSHNMVQPVAVPVRKSDAGQQTRIQPVSLPIRKADPPKTAQAGPDKLKSGSNKAANALPSSVSGKEAQEQLQTAGKKIPASPALKQ